MSVLERAHLLMAHDRPEEAEKTLRGWLAENPEDDRAMAFLARALFFQDRNDEAVEVARAAVGLDPDDSYNHWIHARALACRNDTKEALAAIEEAIRIDPDEPRSYSLKAMLLSGMSRNEEALEAIDTALSLTPEEADLLTNRAMILNALNRPGEAKAAVEASLRLSPDQSDSHTEMGWAHLRDGNAKAAANSFMEALRIDPEDDRARAGIVEALKARIPLYRWILNFFFWLGSMSSRARWGVILGLYFGSKILKAVARTNPEYQPFLYPLLGIYIVFIFLTWTASPLCNLFLRMHPVGKHALDADDKLASSLVGLLLLSCIIMGIAGAVLSIPALMISGLAGLLYMIPLSGAFQFSAGPVRKKMMIFTSGIGLCGIAALASALIGDFKFELLAIYFLGCFFYSWIHNFALHKG